MLSLVIFRQLISFPNGFFSATTYLFQSEFFMPSAIDFIFAIPIRIGHFPLHTVGVLGCPTLPMNGQDCFVTFRYVLDFESAVHVHV